MRHKAHSEHRAMQDQSWLHGEDGSAVFADRCEPLSGLEKSQHGTELWLCWCWVYWSGVSARLKQLHSFGP